MNEVALLNIGEVAKLVSLSEPTIWRKLRNDDFPRPVKLGKGRAVRWFASDVAAWLEGLRSAAYAPQPPRAALDALAASRAARRASAA